jgi:hypothetical protein
VSLAASRRDLRIDFCSAPPQPCGTRRNIGLRVVNQITEQVKDSLQPRFCADDDRLPRSDNYVSAASVAGA